jgi:hypothetical protein
MIYRFSNETERLWYDIMVVAGVQGATVKTPISNNAASAITVS